MKTFVLLLFTSVVVFGCDSPMNNRIESQDNFQKPQKNLKLQSLNFKAETQWLVGPVGNLNVTNTLLVVIKNEQG